MSKRWKSVVAVVAMAATPALVALPAGTASASPGIAATAAPERAAKDRTSLSIRVNKRKIEAGASAKVRGNLNIDKQDTEEGRLVMLQAKAEGASSYKVGSQTPGIQTLGGDRARQHNRQGHSPRRDVQQIWQGHLQATPQGADPGLKTRWTIRSTL